MDYLNHITLNTGHIRKSNPEEVDKGLYFRLKRILDESMRPEGTEIMDGYRLKTTQADGMTLATVYASDGMPVLTIACSDDDDGSLWRLIHEPAGMPLQTKAADLPPLPYVADRLEVGSLVHLDALRWTGDFSRCFGWAVLYPQRIR